MRRHPLAPIVSPFLLRGFLFLVALLGALTLLASPVRAEIGALAAPADLVVEVVSDGVFISWTSAPQQGPVQYTLYRGATPAWEEATAVDAPISSSVRMGTPGVSYSFFDPSAQSGITYIYWVVGENSTESVRFGPYYSAQTHTVFLPLLARS